MPEDIDAKPSYQVGYRKPPPHGRYVKGTSGNPKGRPNGSRNFETVLEGELKKRVPVTEDGKRKKITKREAIAKQLVNKAASGDPKAILVLLNETRAYKADGGVASTETVSPEDEAVMKGIVKRIREAVGEGGSKSPAKPTAEDDEPTAETVKPTRDPSDPENRSDD